MKLFVVLPHTDVAAYKIQSAKHNDRCVKAKKRVGNAVAIGQSIEPKPKLNARPLPLG